MASHQNKIDQKTLTELLSGLIYDQEMRNCCEKISQDAGFSVLECSAIKDGVIPVDNGGYANINYYNYFWNCVSRRLDHRECCVDSGVVAECVPICNSLNHPSFEEMNILLAKDCYSRNKVADVLSTCISKRRGKVRDAQIVLHIDNGEN